MHSAKLFRRSTLLGAALTALLLTAPETPRAGDERSPDPTPSPDDSAARLESLRAALETAFVRGDPDLLRAFLPRRAKIYVAAGIFEVADGYYGADQIVVILRRLFDGRSTLRFGFLPFQGETGARRRLPARWVFRQAGNKSERRIAFTVVDEGGDWHVREIRQWN